MNAKKQDTPVECLERSGLFVCRSVDYYRPFDRVGGQAQVLAHHTLIAVCSGSGRLSVGANTLDLFNGWFVLLPSGTYMEVEDRAVRYEHKLEWLVLSFDLVNLDDNDKKAEACFPESAFFSDDADWNKRITDLLLQWPQRLAGLAESLRFQGTFNLRMADVLTRVENASTDDVSLGQHGSALEQVLAYIHRNYDKKITREDAILLSGLKTRTFTLQFKRRQGITFNEYVNRIRIHKAIEWLLLTEAPLSEIAGKVGYADEFYLSRKFKQVIGLSPSAYVKKRKTYAAMEDAYTVDLLTLGVVPCTAVMNEWVSSRFERMLEAGGCQKMLCGLRNDERLEILRAVKPDLIIVPELGVIERDQMSAIAPLIEMPWQGVGWKQHFERVAALVGEQEQATEWLSSFEARLGKTRSALIHTLDSQATVAIVNVRANSLRIYASAYMGGDLLYDLLRLGPPPLVADMRCKGIDSLYMNDEQMMFLEADYIFLTIERHDEASARLDRLKESGRWRDIRAVRRKQVFDVEMGQLYGYAPAALEAQLDDVEKYLLGT